MTTRPRLAREEAQSFGPEAIPLPNYASDDLFSGTHIGMNEFSVFLLICRCTFTEMKPCFYTDVQMLAFAGRDSKKVSDIQRALQHLADVGYIHIYHTPQGRAIIPDYYADIIAAPNLELE